VTIMVKFVTIMVKFSQYFLIDVNVVTEAGTARDYFCNQ